MSMWSFTRISHTGISLKPSSYTKFSTRVRVLINSSVCGLNRDLVQLLGGAIAGLHSMTDEHFGISVVEYMAAGAIPIGK
jgi:hypothetical protein